MTILTTQDRKLLAALQNDATLSQQELAELSGMSRTSCWRRISELKKSGFIQGQVALLNTNKLGLKIC